MSRVVRRLDIGELRPAIWRDDGTARFQAHLTRCGVFTYRQPDGSVRRELRLPEDVFDSAALDSFGGVPVTDDHPPEMVDASNAKKYTIGSVQGKPRPDDDHVLGDLAVYDGQVLDGMRHQGRKCQVSLGYVCDLDETPGEHPVYGRYDARQLNIRGNHCALVDVARAGSTARVRLDAAEMTMDEVRTDDWTEFDEQRLQGARAASKSAEKASKDAKGAKAKDASKAHRAAAYAHDQAADAWRKVKNETGARDPEAIAKAHDQKSDDHTALARDLESRTRLRGRGQRGDEADISGIDLASAENGATVGSVSDRVDESDKDPKPSLEGSPAKGDPDKGDVASRNAKGANDAKPGDKDSAAKAGAGAEEEGTQDAADDKQSSRPGDGGKPDPKTKKPVQSADPDDSEDDDDDSDDDDADDDADDDEDDDDAEDDDEDRDDCYSASMKDGKMTPEAKAKMAASNFAVPERDGLPMHDPEHCKAAMNTHFAKYDFKNPGEKHRAFNLLKRRAKQFGMSSDAFDKAHGPTLDSEDTTPMPSKKLTAALAKVDALEGQVASLTKDLEVARAARTDAAAVATATDAKVALLVEARGTGATVDSKMSDDQIKRAVVKHVDGIDIAKDKKEGYVDAMYDGALARHRQDVEEGAAGEAALARARVAALPPPAATRGAAAPVAHADEDDLDEQAVMARTQERNAELWAQTPDKFLTPRAKEQF